MAANVTQHRFFLSPLSPTDADRRLAWAVVALSDLQSAPGEGTTFYFTLAVAA